MSRKLAYRIKTEIRACLKAQREAGEVPQDWISHLFNLIDLLEQESRMVTVRLGRFGFCTCLISHSFCSGCWKIKENCTCITLKVNPMDLINEEYTKHIQRIETPVRKEVN